MHSLPHGDSEYKCRSECAAKINARLTHPDFLLTPGECPAPDSMFHRLELQRGSGELLASIRPDYFLTFRLDGIRKVHATPVTVIERGHFARTIPGGTRAVLDDPPSQALLYKRVKTICAVMDWMFFGQNWCKVPSKNRTCSITCIEDHHHVHTLLRLPEGRALTHYTAEYGPDLALSAYLTEVFRQKKIAFSVKASRIGPTMDDVVDVALYCVKQCCSRRVINDDSDFMVPGSQFHPARVQD
jgi:hypothetical protein